MLLACDNLTNFFNHTRDLTLDSRLWNTSELSHPFHSYNLKNITCLEQAPHSNGNTLFKSLILTIMAVVSILANLATIYSIVRCRRRHHSWSAIYTLILQLAVADLFVSVFCIGGEAMWNYTVEWIWGNVACKLFKFFQVFSLYLSTFVLVLIGVDRFFAIRYPMKGMNTADRCLKFIVAAWILSFVLSLPQIIIFRVVQGPFVEKFEQCVTYGFYTEPWQEQLYVSFGLFSMFLLPLGILIATYVFTIITISRSERMFKVKLANNDICHVNGDVNRRKLMYRAKAKSLRISIVIVTAFIFWWTPYYTMMIIFMFSCPDKYVSDELQNIIFFFGMSNSLVNPLIYGAFHLWPRKRRNFMHREISTTQRRLTPTSYGSSYRRDSRETRIPILPKN